MSRPRLALAGLLIAIVAVFAADRVSVAKAAPPAEYDGIAAVALTYDGSWGGQCWTFMQKVVMEATGKRVGFDYRQGFFEAGAMEVTVDEARAGDIIQIADDSYTAPDADYNGLHTAIVLDNNGDGTFRVVDSNSQWDEMVRVRDNYDPASAAGRSGLQFHIYRIGAVDDGRTPAELPDLPVGESALKLGDNARISAGGDCLNLRKDPSIASSIITCLPDGTRLKVVAEPRVTAGRVWVRVSSPAGEGWVAAEYLTRENPPAPASSGGGENRPILVFRTFVPALATGD